MNIIYSGGWNNKLEESIRASFLYTFHGTIRDAASRGKKIAFVTLAKPDGYFSHLIDPLYGGMVDIIDSKSDGVEWGKYDGIFIPGGNAENLQLGMKKAGFSLYLLKPGAVLLGDSAGAYVLSSYYYQSPHGELRGVEIRYLAGFNPEAKVITVAHLDNPVYCNETLIKSVNAFAGEKGIRVLSLRENEQKLLREGQFVDVDRKLLFA